jgi:hypothetical protein
MSEESTPALLGAIPSFEMFMSTWEQLSAKNEESILLMQPGLDLAYKYYGWMDQSPSYIIAVCM